MEGLVLREGLTATTDLDWKGQACLVLAGLDEWGRPFRLFFSPTEQQALWRWWEKVEQQALSESSEEMV